MQVIWTIETIIESFDVAEQCSTNVSIYCLPAFHMSMYPTPVTGIHSYTLQISVWDIKRCLVRAPSTEHQHSTFKLFKSQKAILCTEQEFRVWNLVYSVMIMNGM